MNPVSKAYIQLHICVFLWGFTAILGRLISLQELPLVWYRVVFTCISLLFLPGIIKNIRLIDRREVLKIVGIGCIVCIHWICFYGSIKYSNVSVALSCLATTSFMTSFIEPVLNRRRAKVFEIVLGLLIIPGIYIIFHFTRFFQTGIILGLLAAFFAATFTSMNKIMVGRHEPRSITLIELGGGLIMLTLVLPFYHYFEPSASLVPLADDWFYLVILALGCTTLPFVLSLRALKHLSAFASTLSVNLEPVYGILLAIPFFHENKDLDPRFYFGTLIILAAVFIHPLVKSRFDKDLPIKQ